MLLFIMQGTTAVSLNASAVNSNFLYGNYHYYFTHDYLYYVSESAVFM